MDFAQEQRNPAKHLLGLSFVLILHVVLIYGLVNGLGHKLIEVIKKPYETKLIEEAKELPPDKPPPPPPKLAPPPPPFVPPVEVNISVAAPVANTITQVSRTLPSPPTVEVAKRAPVVVSPVIDANRNCSKPEYPSASRRLDEEGTVVLNFLIDLDGRAVESKVEKSSGFGRLDEAARSALGKCQFKPGTIDGKPERTWASIRYTWKLE